MRFGGGRAAELCRSGAGTETPRGTRRAAPHGRFGPGCAGRCGVSANRAVQRGDGPFCSVLSKGRGGGEKKKAGFSRGLISVRAVKPVVERRAVTPGDASVGLSAARVAALRGQRRTEPRSDRRAPLRPRRAVNLSQIGLFSL